jgi:16S rRNA (uracil1498-N3)-methyltransferase
MPALVLPSERFDSSFITITDDNARYIKDVLRLRKGDRITLYDGAGNASIAQCVQFTKTFVSVSIIDRYQEKRESPIALTLAQVIGTGQTMDLVVQKATELGVSVIIPLITERGQIRKTEKLARWKTIARHAAAQSQRGVMPEIVEPTRWDAFLKDRFGGVLFWERQQNSGLKDILKSMPMVKSLTLAVGPEGGFTETEVKQAQDAQFKIASLGPRILRLETAALVALSIVQYELGDLS